MAASIRELAQLGSTSTIGARDEEDRSSSFTIARGLAPGGSNDIGRDDDSIWNWNNNVEKERQSGEMPFGHPSDVSAIDTDEEEAIAGRNGFMDGVSEDDFYEESVRDTWSADEERRVVRQFDKHLTLFMAALYMLSFLDRS
ncbi:hypothetical protein KEM56_004375, partial [Ascosphaera pollenicola]